MKKRIPPLAGLFCIVLFSYSARAQSGAAVCEGDVTLTSQAEVDAFDCTEVTEYLKISGPDITNLDGLSELVRVGGLRIANNENLTDVDGLSSLEVITGKVGDPETLVISGNPMLGSLDGFSSLTSINGFFRIDHNASLQTIKGFPLISQVEYLNINNNPSLKSLEGFTSLASVRGRWAAFDISNNAALESINGFSSLTEIIGIPYCYAEISNNPSLKNINGLSALSSVDGGLPASLAIENNLMLENIDGLSSLKLLPYANIPTITIANNPSLRRCCGLYPYLSTTTMNVTLENNGSGCTVDDILAGGACSQSVAGFSLINARTGAVIEDFFDSITVDRASPDFFKWTVQANTYPQEVGSVEFRVDNKRKHMENVFPYVLPGQMLTSLKPGHHILTAQVYSKRHKRGEKGMARTAIITITNSAAILNFEVINKNGDVLTKLNNGDEINIGDPAFREITIRANTMPETVGSVKFQLNKHHRRVENVVPYTLFGDQNGRYTMWKPQPGRFELTATPYSQANAGGYAGESLKVYFKVVKKKSNYHKKDDDSIVSHGDKEGPFVSIYPVPVTFELHVRTANLNCHRAIVSIRDVSGRLVYSKKLEFTSGADYSISTANLDLGIYYFQLLGDNGFGKVIKFVKQ